MILISTRCKNPKCRSIFKTTEKNPAEYCSIVCRSYCNPELHPLNKMSKEKARKTFAVVGYKRKDSTFKPKEYRLEDSKGI